MSGCHVVPENDSRVGVVWVDVTLGDLRVVATGEAAAGGTETGQEDIVNVKIG